MPLKLTYTHTRTLIATGLLNTHFCERSTCTCAELIQPVPHESPAAKPDPVAPVTPVPPRRSDVAGVFSRVCGTQSPAPTARVPPSETQSAVCVFVSVCRAFGVTSYLL